MNQRFRVLVCLCALVGCGLLTGCATETKAPTPTAKVSDAPGYRQLHAKYFSKLGGCAASSCHGGTKGISGLSFANADASYKQLLGVTPINSEAAKAGLLRVKAGKPSESLLFLKLTASPAVLSAKHYGAAMPIGGEGAPGVKSREAIQKWIEAGAPLEGADFTADIAESEDAKALWIPCAAKDESGLRACLGPAPDAKKFLRIYSPPITVPADSEVTVCSYLDVALTQDVVLQATRGKQMAGGHHAAVFVAVAPQSNHAPHVCSSAEMSNLRFVAGAGGQGGQDTVMPLGIALKIAKNQQIVLQSHYHNTTAVERVVMDAVDIEFIAPGATPKVADPFAMISSDFVIPKGTGTFMSEKVCTLDRDMSVYMLLGHTHENGVLFTYEHLPAVTGAPNLLYQATDGKLLRNTPEIKQYSDPLPWKKGDKLRVRCTWQQTDHDMGWPEEMCVGLVYYTDGAGFLACDSGDLTPQVLGGGGEKGCAPVDNKGNELGVGKACTKEGDECSDNLTSTLCLGIFDASQNYCSFTGCDKDADCGKGAHCSKDPKGSACQPDVCK